MQTAARSPNRRTACDRCYQLKERCQHTATSAQCARCRRLGIVCATVRPVRPVGGRAHRGQSRSNTLLDLASLPPDERALLRLLLREPESQGPYVVCSGFREEQQSILAAQLPDALPLLKDAYLAWAVTLQQRQSGSATDVDSDRSLGYIAKAMRVLRALSAASSQERTLGSVLGSALSFSIYAAVGVGVPDICRFCLGAAPSAPHADPWQNLLVLLDTADCLVHRRKPTRRIQIQIPALVVDRHLGLCLPLLPHYHDLCVISNTLVEPNDASALTRLQEQLGTILAEVAVWQPAHLDHLMGKFDAADIVGLLAQAKVYRIGALLIGHRLRCPFGQEDAQAAIWCQEVMIELEIAARVTKRPVRFVTLPFIIAAVEARGESQRSQTLTHVDDFVDCYAPFLKTATKTFLSRLWYERDAKLTSRWFDSVYKPCPVLNSINEAVFNCA